MIAFLDKIAEAVKPRIVKRQKWHHLPKGRAELRESIDQAESILWPVLSTSHPDVRTLQDRVAQLYEQDAILGGASKLAGYYGSFEPFLQNLVREAGGLVGQSRIKFDHAKAVHFIRSEREFYNKTRFHYRCTARITGISVRRRFTVGPVTFQPMTLSQLNSSEPFLNPFKVSGARFPGHDRVLASFEFVVPIDRAVPTAFFAASEKALAEATRLLEQSLDAISVATGTAHSYHSLQLDGGFDSGIRRLIPSETAFAYLTMTAHAVRKAQRAHEWIAASGNTDRTLAASVSRVVLAHKRLRVTDRLVDLVIAWESITLTTAGNAIKGELSYRFAVNSALLFIEATRPKSHRTVRPFEGCLLGKVRDRARWDRT